MYISYGLASLLFLITIRESLCFLILILCENITLSNDDSIIQVKELKKTFLASGGNRIQAVDGISFDVKRREIFGLLGPNGAGKSTTIGMLTTSVIITGGRALIAGIDVAADPIGVKKEIAVVPQGVNLDRSLTARENLIFHAKYFGIDRVEREKRAQDLLELMALSNRASDYPPAFSGGMARRLQIARALMHNPRILFLDEATTGLDPQSRLMIWHKIRDLNASGQTIFLTTHHMEEADQLCDRVAIMDHGKILSMGTPAELKEMIPHGNVVEVKVSQHHEELPGWLKDEVKGLERVESEDNTLRLFLARPEEAMIKVIETIRNHDVNLESIQLHP
ncbi:MAG TPA: ATP-binding cassette domain-containing protein, partial [Actinobacteria bacterium]|nr:ATP-binding cassette domain-containing protein [Actinomycetota bacterium]